MPRQSLVELALPLDLPEPAAKPSGEVFDTRRPYTLPMTRRVAMARIIGPYTELDRKLWATLIALAWDHLPTRRIHEVNARNIARLYRELKGGQKGTDWIMASARRLGQTQLEWDNPDEAGTVSLLAGLKIQKISGHIAYSFSDFLIEKLLDNQQFSRLRLHFMIGLSGKYSVTLYMLLESAANKQFPTIEMTIAELRKSLSVPEGKLGRWVDLNRFAIEPAMKQINDNAAAAGFSVDVETIVRGRKIERVRFTITKADARIADEDAHRVRISHRADSAAKAERVAPRYDTDDALVLIRKDAPGLDPYPILADFDAWLKGSKEPVKNPMGALRTLARKRRKELGGRLFEEEMAPE